MFHSLLALTMEIKSFKAYGYNLHSAEYIYYIRNLYELHIGQGFSYLNTMGHFFLLVSLSHFLPF